jgi:PHD/YefM family antitoxin component YafN of YafNO toxin-antitoxin module
LAGTVSLDNLVSVSDLSHGGVSRTLNQVSDNNPVVVMRNNKPSAIIISPEDFKRYTQAEEDFALYLEAVERDNEDGGTRRTMDEVFGSEYTPVADGFTPELE